MSYLLNYRKWRNIHEAVIFETDTTPKLKGSNPKWKYLWDELKLTSSAVNTYNSGRLKWYSSQSKDGSPETHNEFPVISLSISSSDQVVRLLGNEKSEVTLRDIQSKLKDAGFSDEDWGWDYSMLTEDQVVTALKSIAKLIYKDESVDQVEME